MPKILNSYVLVSALEPTIVLDTTTWQYGQATSCTLTVTLGDNNEPYSGTVNLGYSSGISGPPNVTCTNGSASVSITRSATGTATLTVTVPVGDGVKEKSQQFSGNTAGQSVYIDGNTFWVEWRYGHTNDEGGGCAAGFTNSRMRIVVNGTNIFWDTGHTGQNPTNGYYRGDLIYHVGKSISNSCTQTDMYGVILHE